MNVDPGGALGPEHPVHFGHRGGHVGNVFEDQGREDEIKGIIGESELGGIHQTDIHPVRREIFPGLPGQVPEKLPIKEHMP